MPTFNDRGKKAFLKTLWEKKKLLEKESSLPLSCVMSKDKI